MAKERKPETSRGLAVFCARIADEKIARDILILNLRKIDTSPTDFFVICTCDTETQMRAVIDSVLKKCGELGITKPRIEGYQSTQWVLIDFFDVVFHVMLSKTREYYNIEKLWGDAQFLKLTENGTARKADFKP